MNTGHLFVSIIKHSLSENINMTYRLSIADRTELDKLHHASLKTLAQTGLRFMHKDALAIFSKNGFKIKGDIVYINESQVDNALASCPPSFEFQALDPARKLIVGEDFVHAQPNAGAPFVHDSVCGRRKAILEDHANIVKICQKLDSISFNGSMPVDPSDVSHRHKHMYMLRESLKYSNKPVMGMAMNRLGANQQIDLMDIAIGENRNIEDAHWIGVVVNPHSPLAWEPEGLETIFEFVKRNQPVVLSPAIMAGIAGPIDLVGTSVVQNAELLSGIVLTQLIRPGASIVYSTASTIADMRRASFCAGSPETMLINLPCLQLARDRYNLPARTMCGLTESSEIDIQAGFESMMSMMFGYLNGANILVQTLGTLEALMSTSYEKIIIDAENFSRMQRYQKGVDFSTIDASLELIQKVGHKADYLTRQDTFAKFKSLWSPSVSVWGNAKDKADSSITRAREKYKHILDGFKKPLLPENTIAALDRYIIQAQK